MRLTAACIALSLVLAGASPLCAQKLDAHPWEDCIRAPDRACLLEEAVDLLNLQDRTDRRQTLVATIAETWAQAGEIDTATQLAAQVPDRLLVRAAVLREIAAAYARASNLDKAEATFDQALRLANGWKNPLQRAQALHSIAQAQAAAGMKAAAEITLDQALEAATTRIGSIADDPRTRAQTLLALADLQVRAGLAPRETLDEALAAARGVRLRLGQWPSLIGIDVMVSGSGDVLLLCDVAKAQARAGLTAKAIASFDEALRAAEGIKTPTQYLQGAAIAGALATVADAQREAGLEAAARATLDRAATAVEAITGDFYRAQALARLAEVLTKARGAAHGVFARALSIARALPGDQQRAQALQRIATAQANAGLRDEGARTFVEAVGFARLRDKQALSGNANPLFVSEALLLGQDWQMSMLSEIADAQCRAGLIDEAAATFEEALTVTLSSDQRRNAGRLVLLIKNIVNNDHAHGVIAASPALRARLVEAAETITERVSRAEMLSAIARALPN